MKQDPNLRAATSGLQFRFLAYNVTHPSLDQLKVCAKP